MFTETDIYLNQERNNINVSFRSVLYLIVIQNRNHIVRSNTVVGRARDGTGTGRSVLTGRPARVVTLKVCFFHVKIYETSAGSQEYLPDNI